MWAPSPPPSLRSKDSASGEENDNALWTDRISVCTNTLTCFSPPPSLRSKDSALGEEIDRVGSSLSRSVENVRIKKEQLTKNERAMQVLEDEVRRECFEGGNVEVEQVR